MIDEMLCYEVLDFDLPHAIYSQQRCAESFASILLQQRWPEDDVRQAGYPFVQGLVQRIAEELGIYRCELDACTFASFDNDGPAIETEVTDTE
ncbi:hypothetical protein BGLA2_3150003 [Burkholderia gladioli]|uniref:hypothetical protein n=1 Tax=Burkholderia gladioli TaxID=28095 RepID=UPI001CAB84D0|nr:hypothetical protein BGLA2_3150003 [Burkholderia gladioli]